MIAFDAAHEAVHYPPDRRFRIWIRPSILIGAAIAILALIAAAWIEVAVIGMPRIPPVPQIYPNDFAGPHGFPLWVRYCHFFNFFFVMLLIRSGLSILMDHPRLYFNDHCTPGSEWIRFTPLEVPRDRIWTAKDDARYISPRGRHARIPAHHRRRADLAFHHGPRIHRHGRYLHRHAFRYRAMEASGADVSAGAGAGLEHLGALRDVSLASGTERVLRLQRLAADRLFCGCLRLWRAGHSDRHRDVARGGEPISVVREDLRGQAGGAIDSLPYHAWLPGVPRRACDFDRDDRLSCGT